MSITSYRWSFRPLRRSGISLYARLLLLLLLSPSRGNWIINAIFLGPAIGSLRCSVVCVINDQTISENLEGSHSILTYLSLLTYHKHSDLYCEQAVSFMIPLWKTHKKEAKFIQLELKKAVKVIIVSSSTSTTWFYYIQYFVKIILMVCNQLFRNPVNCAHATALLAAVHASCFSHFYSTVSPLNATLLAQEAVWTAFLLANVVCSNQTRLPYNNNTLCQMLSWGEVIVFADNMAMSQLLVHYFASEWNASTMKYCAFMVPRWQILILVNLWLFPGTTTRCICVKALTHQTDFGRR